MLIDIVTNPMFIMFAIFFAMFLLSKFVFGSSKKKEKKTKGANDKKDAVQKTEEKKDDHSDTVEKKSDETAESDDEPKLVFKRKKSAKQKKLKKIKEQPKISKVYERVETKHKQEDAKIVEPDISEEELLKKMQFVNTSKTVSKLVKNEPVQEGMVDENNEEIIHEHVHTGDGPCVVEEIAKLKKHGHFDRSKRLSRCIKENDFDNMFESHISEDYMNINVDRHLNIGKDFSSSLYERASKTLANSDAKILIDNDDAPNKLLNSASDYNDSMKVWLENRRREELAKFMLNHDSDGNDESNFDVEDFEINGISAKSLMVGQAVMKRKGTSKNWLVYGFVLNYLV